MKSERGRLPFYFNGGIGKRSHKIRSIHAVNGHMSRASKVGATNDHDLSAVEGCGVDCGTGARNAPMSESGRNLATGGGEVPANVHLGPAECNRFHSSEARVAARAAAEWEPGIAVPPGDIVDRYASSRIEVAADVQAPALWDDDID